MNIDDMTIGQAKEFAAMLPKGVYSPAPLMADTREGLNSMIGEKVIIRTYSAGVWFGVLSEKSGNEVIISNARRMWRWKAKKSVSLSAVALHGIDCSASSIVEAVNSVWLEAIEITPCTNAAIESIEGAENATAR